MGIDIIKNWEDFYPRPPRGGRRWNKSGGGSTMGFLSTPSARRATTSRDVQPRNLVISIHALREEGDLRYPKIQIRYQPFLSTPSARRAT